MSAVEWISKDRFAAKRLRGISDDLTDDKRKIIKDHSAFASLLDVSPFHVPNELIDFVAVNTSAKLREFNYNGKRIVFTKDMVSKVFNLKSGIKPVNRLSKSVRSDMKDFYKGNLQRLPIDDVATLLKKEDAVNQDAVIRHWDLLCCATVLYPGSGNMMCLDYLASMDHPKKIVYMDHLDIPRSVHCFNYSLPRACFVTCADFSFIVEIDRDDSIPNKKTLFGKRPFLELSKTVYGAAAGCSNVHVEETELNPSASLNEWLLFPSMQDFEVPPRLKHLYDKHRVLFASEVEDSTKQFCEGLKNIHSKRMACLLVDVDAAMRAGNGPSVVFSTDTSPNLQGNVPNDQASQEEDAPEQANVGDIRGKANAGTNAGEAKDGDVTWLTAKEIVYKKRDGVKKKKKKEGKKTNAATDVAVAQDHSTKGVTTEELSHKDVPAVVHGAKEVSDVLIAAKDVPAKDVPKLAAKVDDQQKRTMDKALKPKWCEQKKRLKLPEVTTGVGDDQMSIQVAEITEGQQQNNATIAADNSSCGITQPNVRQTAVIVDSTSTGADAASHDDVNSPVRSPNVDPIPKSPRRVLPPGYWDDIPSFELWSQSQGSRENNTVDIPLQGSDPTPQLESDAATSFVAQDEVEAQKDVAATDALTNTAASTADASNPVTELWSQDTEWNNILDMPKKTSDAITPPAVADALCSDIPATDGSEEPEAMLLPTDDTESVAEHNTVEAPADATVCVAAQRTVATSNAVATQNTDKASIDESDVLTPVQLNTKDDDVAVATENAASVGHQTLEKKRRFKRKAKDDVSPTKVKKIKVSQHATQAYEQFVTHTRKLKADPKRKNYATTDCSTPFIVIGRTHCSYKSFNSSLRPRQPLDSQIMNLWTEYSNKVSKNASHASSKALKKYAFSCYLTMKLTLDPEEFDSRECMREFKVQNAEFKILNQDILHFPVVKSQHWILCSVNLLHKQFHTFDSIMNSKNKSIMNKAANNLFTNFKTLVNDAGAKIDWSRFTNDTPAHPQQKTIYDCGFYSMMFMGHFNGKVMADFESSDMPNFRKMVASTLIDNRENKVDLTKIMEEDLVAE